MIIFNTILIITCVILGFLYYKTYPWTSGWVLGIGFCTLINLVVALAIK